MRDLQSKNNKQKNNILLTTDEKAICSVDKKNFVYQFAHSNQADRKSVNQKKIYLLSTPHVSD